MVVVVFIPAVSLVTEETRGMCKPVDGNTRE